MRVAVIDYGSGNLHSVLHSLKTATTHAGLPHDCFLTSSPEDVLAADYVVLPGVGAFADCARNLASVDGMMAALREAVLVKRQPFLGICVGMQLMAARGLEDGETPGLGWIDGVVDRIIPEPKDGLSLKIPHMGWNGLELKAAHPVLEGLSSGDAVYFVHSYHMTLPKDDQLLATTDYGGRVVAAIGDQNMVGTQFHPEKSQGVGQQLLTNWLTWKP